MHELECGQKATPTSTLTPYEKQQQKTYAGGGGGGGGHTYLCSMIKRNVRYGNLPSMVANNHKTFYEFFNNDNVRIKSAYRRYGNK